MIPMKMLKTVFRKMISIHPTSMPSKLKFNSRGSLSNLKIFNSKGSLPNLKIHSKLENLKLNLHLKSNKEKIK